MSQPTGFNSASPSKVCCLRKSLYGLKQSARVWYACLDSELRHQSMIRLPNEQAFWMCPAVHPTDHPEFTLAHVDDLLFIGTKQQTAIRKSLLASKYEFKDMGPASTFTGLQITRDHPNRRVYIDQVPYVLEILEEFGLLDTTPVTIPMDPKESWDTNHPLCPHAKLLPTNAPLES